MHKIEKIALCGLLKMDSWPVLHHRLTSSYEGSRVCMAHQPSHLQYRYHSRWVLHSSMSRDSSNKNKTPTPQVSSFSSNFFLQKLTKNHLLQNIMLLCSLSLIFNKHMSWKNMLLVATWSKLKHFPALICWMENYFQSMRNIVEMCDSVITISKFISV